MKYNMVRQFSNNALDNLFNFFFRWVDFGKMLFECFWTFLSIWQAFFGIFYNILMYFYYLLLFVIDRGSEEATVPRLFRQPVTGRLSSTPPVRLAGVEAPITTRKIATSVQSTASSVSSAVSSATSTVSDVVSSVAPPQRTAATTGGSKTSIFKSIGEGIISFFLALGSILKQPFVIMKEYFAEKMKPVKDDEQALGKSNVKRSLIDEYMKEYERQRK